MIPDWVRIVISLLVAIGLPCFLVAHGWYLLAGAATLGSLIGITYAATRKGK